MVIANVHQFDLGLKGRQEESLREFVDIVKRIMDLMEGGVSTSTILSSVLKWTDYERWLLGEEGSDTSENSRISNLKELVRTAERFKTVPKLLEYIRDMEREKRKRKIKRKDAEAYVRPNLVQLMSIHKCKGLEFPVVFLVGASEKILPHGKSTDIEEERRLFYVAVTRAEDLLYVTSPEVVSVGGQGRVLEPSRFAREARLL